MKKKVVAKKQTKKVVAKKKVIKKAVKAPKLEYVFAAASWASPVTRANGIYSGVFSREAGNTFSLINIIKSIGEELDRAGHKFANISINFFSHLTPKEGALFVAQENELKIKKLAEIEAYKAEREAAEIAANVEKAVRQEAPVLKAVEEEIKEDASKVENDL